MPIFHKQTEVGDRLTAELSRQSTEGRPTLSLHASESEDSDLRQIMRLLSQGRTAFAPRFYEIKERDLTLCACQLKGKRFWRSAIKVKDEQLPLSIKKEYGLEMGSVLVYRFTRAVTKDKTIHNS